MCLFTTLQCYMNGFLKQNAKFKQTKIYARVVQFSQSSVQSLYLVKIKLGVSSHSDVGHNRRARLEQSLLLQTDPRCHYWNYISHTCTAGKKYRPGSKPFSTYIFFLTLVFSTQSKLFIFFSLSFAYISGASEAPLCSS